MANPYHDGSGRFCSKGEMQAAIDTYAKNGDLDNYFKLRKELEEIEANRVTVSKELLGKVIKGYRMETKDPEEIREIYSDLKQSPDAPAALDDAMVTLYRHPDTPADIKEDIAANASTGLKIRLARSIANNKEVSPDDILRLVKDEQNSDIVESALSSPLLTFDQKREIAARQEIGGMASLARSNPREFFSDPELRKKLIDETKELAQTNHGHLHYNLVACAASPDEEAHDLVINSNDIQNIYHSSYNTLSDNRNLSTENAIRLLKKTQLNRMDYFDSVRNGVTLNFSGREIIPEIFNYNGAKFSKQTPYKGSPPEELKAELEAHIASVNERVKSQEYVMKWETEGARNRLAYLDSFEANQKDLLKRRKRLSKPRSPQMDSEGYSIRGIDARLERANDHLAATQSIALIEEAFKNHALKR